jgi:hypothetical protein
MRSSSIHTYFLVLLITILASSCTFYKEVKVNEVKEVAITRFDQAGVTATVTVAIDNPNWYKVVAQKGEVNVTLNGKPAGVIRFDERYIIPKKSTGEYTFTLDGSFDPTQGGGGFLDTLLNLIITREATFEANGELHGKAMFVKRKVPVVFTEKVDLRNMNR